MGQSMWSWNRWYCESPYVRADEIGPKTAPNGERTKCAMQIIFLGRATQSGSIQSDRKLGKAGVGTAD
jgi:hypothetical protein